MKYIDIPKEIGFNEIIGNNYSLSASQYKNLVIKNNNLLTVKSFLSRELKRSDLGTEIGSLNYIDRSSVFFMRTKALQYHSFIPDINKESALPIMPRCFRQMNLKKGDFLISKDSNIGESVILDKDYPNFMVSGGIYKLPIAKHTYYLFAMLKHSIFKDQLDYLVPKSATIRHAKTKFLDVKIPIPNVNKQQVMKYIELLTVSVINKEIEILNKNKKIHQLIIDELDNNQQTNKFNYEFPSYEDLIINKRIDAGFYSEDHQQKIFKVKNYSRGFKPLDQQGLLPIPGPSLEIKLLGTRIDSKKEINGFYRLITPKQITDFGTVEYFDFIGTPKEIKPIKFGDILFGESGTGRSMVYLDYHAKTINNAHAHILRPKKQECSLEKAIFVRAILSYYKNIGVIDYMTVGGQGGHLSPSYFDRIYIPEFPTYQQKAISKLYYNPKAKIKAIGLTLNNFELVDQSFVNDAGITELDESIKKIKKQLNFVIEQIINDKTVGIDFSFL